MLRKFLLKQANTYLEIIIMRISKRSQAEFGMLFVAFIWGTTFVLVKNALADISPFTFLGLRFLIAFAILGILAYRDMKQINLPTILAGSLLGLFLFFGYIFQTIGLQYTTSSNAGFITGLSVVLVPIIYAVFAKTWPEIKTIITVIIAAFGLFLLSFQSNSLHLAYGDFLVLFCAFAFAFHIVFVDRLSHQYNAVAITGVQILFVGLLCMVIGLFVEPWPEHFTTNAVSAILITAVFATALAFLLQNSMQKHSTPIRFALILTMEPVFAALAGFLWADEMLSARAMVGAAFILVAMLFSILAGKKEDLQTGNIKRLHHCSDNPREI